MNELAHEGHPVPLNENDEIVVFASIDSLIDEFKKRFSSVLIAARNDAGEILIDWGGSDFDNDYAVALCEKMKIALIDEDKDQNSVFFFDRNDFSLGEDDEDDADEHVVEED